jgi:hypothetical protein
MLKNKKFILFVKLQIIEHKKMKWMETDLSVYIDWRLEEGKIKAEFVMDKPY